MRHKWFGLSGLVALLALLPACSDPSSGEEGTSPPPDSTPAPSDQPIPADWEEEEPAPSATDTPTPDGQLIAGDWDDNLNFGLFQKYLSRPPLKWTAPKVADRVLITVRDGKGKPLSNARITVATSAGTQRLAAPTASDGRVLFMPTQDGATSGESFQVTVAPGAGQAGQTLTASVQGGRVDVTLPDASATPPTQLDVAFLLDTTGSMSDELTYLKKEMQAMVDSVSTTFPGVSARFALVLYRDDGDIYVVRPFDFTSDVATFRKQLEAQSANGGGDLPEAMERAMEGVNKLSWRTGNTARITFLMTDAPSHLEANTAFFNEVHKARKAGIRVYPVAASGVAEEAEFQLRQAAQLTLGRYIFLTDDSGIGDEHAIPHIPCYQVQLLKSLLIRAIDSELEGKRRPASGSDILRTVGSPSPDGTCRLPDGTVTYLSNEAWGASLRR